MISGAIGVLLIFLGIICFIPASVFFVEVVASRFAQQRKDWEEADVSVAVLIPAHNESAGLSPTLADVRMQLRSSDRLIVVSDNSSDNTAEIARSNGAEVIERNDRDRLGKGYALNFGLLYLAENPPDVLIVVDADCRIGPGAVTKLASMVKEHQAPVQALDLMLCPVDADVRQRASEFAWRIKNEIRPLGLHALGAPCQLMGTGMAFPWSVLTKAHVATGHIVEDLNLGLDLASAGYAPVFCPEAVVFSVFPTSKEAAEKQRHRWEHGHVRLLLSATPKLLMTAIKRRDSRLFALALDLAVPPLGLLGFLLCIMTGISLVFSLTVGSIGPLLFSALGLALYGSAIFLCWVKAGRELLPLAQFPAAVWYLASKFKLYGRLLSGRGEKQWVRTDRN